MWQNRPIVVESGINFPVICKHLPFIAVVQHANSFVFSNRPFGVKRATGESLMFPTATIRKRHKSERGSQSLAVCTKCHTIQHRTWLSHNARCRRVGCYGLLIRQVWAYRQDGRTIKSPPVCCDTIVSAIRVNSQVANASTHSPIVAAISLGEPGT